MPNSLPQTKKANFQSLQSSMTVQLLGELTIKSVGRNLDREITRIENVCHASKNLDSVTL